MARAIKKHNGFYDYSKSIYVGALKKLSIICPKHGAFKQEASSHLRGKGCDKCRILGRRTTTLEFIEQATKMHNGKYDYSKSIYTTSISKLLIICPKHGKFKQVASSHLRGIGCAKCGVCKRADESKKTTSEFIKQATKIHGGYYDYSKSIYDGVIKSIIIVCPVHGQFKQKSGSHLMGQGCAKCGACKSAKARKKTTEEFIKQATKIHDGYYDYSKSVYGTALKKITIICPKHGEFRQDANGHLKGMGCRKCYADKLAISLSITHDEFIEMATKAHKGIYNYSKSVYVGCDKKVIIICPKHGEFKQTAMGHYNGQGCPRCVGSISKLETLWLNLLSVPVKFRQKTIKINGRTIRADAADVNKKIVWEFYGDFWHGNLKKYNPDKINFISKYTFSELNAKTMARERAIKDAGYTVISIWESDFLNSIKKQA